MVSGGIARERSGKGKQRAPTPASDQESSAPAIEDVIVSSRQPPVLAVRTSWQQRLRWGVPVLLLAVSVVLQSLILSGVGPASRVSTQQPGSYHCDFL